MFGQTEYENILNEDYYGFEVSTGDDGWWMQQPENFSIDTNKGANSSSRSLKYTNATSFTGSKKAFGSTTISEMLINLDPGTYTLKAMVWIESGSLSNIKANFRTAGESDVNAIFDLSGVALGQWVEVSTNLTMGFAFADTNVRIMMDNSYGTGTLFFDDFQLLVEKTEEIPLISEIKTSGDENLSLESGNYEISLNVWLEETTTISKFYTYIVNPWVASEWDLSSIEKGKWVNLKQEFSIDQAVVDSEFRIVVNNDPEYGGGKGVFYVDDISFLKTSSNSGNNDNLLISVIGETCPDKENGKLNISAKVEENYTIDFDGQTYSFNDEKVIENIAPGVYDLCVTIEGGDYERCFNLKVEEAQEVAGKISDKGGNTLVEIEQGTAPFQITVNGDLVMNTMAKSVEIKTKSGDKIEVSTSNDCEGKLENEILEFVIFPNPATDSARIISKEGSSLEMISISGGVVIPIIKIPTYYDLDVSQFKPGVYFVRLTNQDKTQTEKLIVK
jgi:hypothetical protein